MGLIDGSIHLLSFLTPALAIATMVVLASRLTSPAAAAVPWWAQIAANFTVGGLVLAAGLWYWGVDAKMSTYALLVLAIASTQWACERCWRR